MNKIRIIIVDDSAVIRNILSKYLNEYEEIEIVAVASDAYDARDKIVKLKPDVITLDLNMPKMNGLEFIQILMKHYPLPIIVVSSLVQGNCENSIKALELGAADIFPKPDFQDSSNMREHIYDLYEKILEASKIRNFRKTVDKNESSQNIKTPAVTSYNEKKILNTNIDLIAIGASTGGTRALTDVLEKIPSGLPPIIITQHMPAGFTKGFADRLNAVCKNIEVREAVDNEELYKGLVLIAPGDYHLLVKKKLHKIFTVVKTGPKVCHQRPAVDVMMASVATEIGNRAIGAVLTGMGSDGADGLFKMKQKGAQTITQSEKTCVVYGMPKAAFDKGASDYVVDLDLIPQKIVSLL